MGRSHLDRGEKIAMCLQRCLSMWDDNGTLTSSTSTTQRRHDGLCKIIHVGGAPTDILAANSIPSRNRVNRFCVAMGSHSAEELPDSAERECQE
ncbi:hypothetical protein ACHAXA_001305 [Cyclostephanos tholiformis]|uniref:Uncharacterized protein n=1 Tax=Cyclostephanos tholiformis TaxID=382380 RepID=A0ABD3RQH7_9STRA